MYRFVCFVVSVALRGLWFADLSMCARVFVCIAARLLLSFVRCVVIVCSLVRLSRSCVGLGVSFSLCLFVRV